MLEKIMYGVIVYLCIGFAMYPWFKAKLKGLLAQDVDEELSSEFLSLSQDVGSEDKATFWTATVMCVMWPYILFGMVQDWLEAKGK